VSKKQTDPKQQETWEEIFDSIDMDYIPIEYIEKIIIKFKDKTVWDIDINDSRKKQPVEEIENSLETLFEQYENHIDTIDFRIDFHRVSNDLTRRVNRFLKLNK
jgi:hypothetical protein